MLQSQLPTLPEPELQRACDELEPDLYELSRHMFGNYLVSKLLAAAPVRPACRRQEGAPRPGSTSDLPARSALAAPRHPPHLG